HSAWLTFMKNRLEEAKKLLHPEGLIAIQCDDNENAYLKLLMDSIFKRKNFLNNVAVKMSEASGVKMNHAKGRFPKLKEYILIYRMPSFKGFVTVDKYRQNVWDSENNILLENLTEKQRNELIEIEAKEINEPADAELASKILSKVKKISLSQIIKKLKLEGDDLDEWLFENSYRIIKTAGSSSLAKLAKSLKNTPDQDIAAAVSNKGILFFYITDFNRNTKQPRLQVIFADSNIFKNPCDFWQDIKTTGAISDEGGVKLSNGKKPEKVLYRLIKMVTNENELVLDYHLGSGTTVAVAHKMNRRYIGVEQLDYGKNDSVERLKNVIKGDKTGVSEFDDVNWKGGGSFVYCELAKNNQKAIDKIMSCKSLEELITFFDELYEKYFLNYNVNVREFKEKIVNEPEFKKLKLDRQKEIFARMLDLNQLYVNVSDMEDSRFKLSDEDISLTKNFYQL
ncbi:MAG: site-specific DNA-methyltransferase, partial [Bacteroidales bacterium]|nr:site-specific DNA-methyltransferase [Bacteroidales bacterium]